MAPAAQYLAEGAMTSRPESVRIFPAEQQRKDRVVHARFSTREIALIQTAADAAGLTVSAFMRSLTIEGAGVRPFFTPDDIHILDVLRSEIRALGVNLNQLSRAVNRGGAFADEELAAALGEVQKLVANVLLELRQFSGDAIPRRRAV